MKKNTHIGILSAIVIIIIFVGGYLIYRPIQTTSTDPQISVVVTNFGLQLQKVSILSPTVKQDIGTTYAQYVDPVLLQQWENDPVNAPGRKISSPWPDHIEITNIEKLDTNTYTVTGSEILLTSNEVEHGGNAGTIPVTITVSKKNNTWIITKYQEGMQQIPEAVSTTTSPITTKPVILSILSIKPSGGSVGTNVILQGTGFNTTSQVVLNGDRGAITKTRSEANGTLLTFVIPDSVGAYCLPKQACPMYELLLKPDTYTLEVRNADGSVSNSVQFTLTNS